MVTVVFADLVGFTTFSETADPEHVKHLVDTCFEVMAREVTAFGGQVDKIVGDALVAMFGAPVTHEDDAERAVRCALQMQAQLAGLREREGLLIEMRVGINTGEVLVGALRGGGDYTAMGDVVNTASRLQTVAQPGQVVVGPSTYTATRDAVRYSPLGALAVKGRERLVDAWVALDALAPPGTRQRRERTPFVGRDTEIALLRGIFASAEAHHRAHFVLVTGDAGVGKSRLVEEASEEAIADHGARILRGRCIPYGEDVWWPITEAVRDACGLEGDEGPEETRARIVSTVAAATSKPETDPEVDRITRALLYPLGHAEELHDIDPTRARDDVMRSLQVLLSGMTREHMLVVVLSDLHWADDLVLDSIDRLLEGLRALPLVLLATARPELLERWQPRPGRHNLVVLNLDPLDLEAVTTIAQRLLPDQLDDDIADLLYERSGGNPFFVEELVALLREQSPEPTSVLADLQAADLPATLRGLVSARLDALAADERNVLEDCAVVGAHGTESALRALTEARDDPTDVRDALERLSNRGLVELEDGEYSFVSEVVREVAYATLTKAERARRHVVLGEWLAQVSPHEGSAAALVERAAHHYGTAAELLQELGSLEGISPDLADRALQVLERAAARATDAEIWRSAFRLYDRCLALLPASAPDEVRHRLLLGRATALAEQREITAAGDDIQTVLNHPDVPPRVVARACTILGGLRQKEGDYEGALAILADAIERWRRLADDRGLAIALRARGMTLLFSGDLDAADEDCREALELYRRAEDRRGEAWSIQNLSTIAFFRGDPARAEERLAVASDRFRELGDWGGLNWSTSLLAWVRFQQGRRHEAEQLALEALPESEERGDRYVTGLLDLLLGSIALWSGRITTAVERADQALARFRAINDPWAIGQAQALAIRALAAAGRISDALACLPPGEGAPRPRPAPLVPRAQMLAHIGSPEAQSEIARIGAPDAAARGVLMDTEFRRTLGLVLLQAGRVNDALTELEGAVAALGDVNVATDAVLALTYVAAGRSAEAGTLVAAHDGDERATYLDRLWLGLAGAFVELQTGAPTALDSFDALVEDADRTDSRLDQALAHLARAHAAESLGAAVAGTARAEADRRLRAIGLEAPGWDRVFSLAARQ